MSSTEGQSGGVSFASTVGTIVGDVTGRDKITHVIHVAAAAHEAAFAPVAEAIRAAPPGAQPQAETQLAELKAEAAKGKAADDGVMAKLVNGLVGLVPGAVTALGKAFAAPVLQGLAAPVTRIVLQQLGQG